ncbi:hypothetical protein FH972_022823 [Carpinus fangiana]|uniref:Uncharacterized protein n=1 Tax=Carpinus fangiana TaxID=176857 RepID=A0A5N6KVK9_9ROSI|nr:hypothetical protein FH972_022823 [Carpinus fangiana]
MEVCDCGKHVPLHVRCTARRVAATKRAAKVVACLLGHKRNMPLYLKTRHGAQRNK